MEEIRHSNTWTPPLQFPNTFTSKYFSNTNLTSRNLKTVNHNRMKRKSCKININSTDTNTVDNQKRKLGDRSPGKKGKQNDALNADTIFTLSLNLKTHESKYGHERLKDCFYDVSCIELAKGILGKILVRRLNDGTILKGRIVETECYLGGEDKASHSYNGRLTERSKPMYMKPGTIYVYLTYGLYHCFNISSQGIAYNVYIFVCLFVLTPTI